MSEEQPASRPARGSRRISFGEASPVITSDAGENHELPEALAAQAHATWADAASRGSVGVDALTPMLEKLDLVRPGDVPAFMQRQLVLPADAPEVSREDFLKLVSGLEDWKLSNFSLGGEEGRKGGGELTESLRGKLHDFFAKLDSDADGCISRQEAVAFWGKNFARLNAEAMFNEVDVDGDGRITSEEWLEFWANVLQHGYSAEEVEEEVDELVEGGAWVDWNDGRATARAGE